MLKVVVAMVALVRTEAEGSLVKPQGHSSEIPELIGSLSICDGSRLPWIALLGCYVSCSSFTGRVKRLKERTKLSRVKGL